MNYPGYPLGTVKPLMEPEGKGTSGVLVMGESLGEMEERDRLPFRPHAEAGSVLERALWRAGVPRDSLTLSNLVWYRPPGNALEGTAWEMDAIRACQHLNAELVEKVRPRCILALGGLAFRELTGMAGPKQGISQCRGFVVPGFAYPGIPVVGTYHPSYLRRGSKERQKSGPRAKVEAAGGGTQGMALLGVLIRDIQLAVEIAAKGTPEFIHDPYQLGATLDDWEAFERDAIAHPELPISYDWETPTSAKVLSEEEIEAGVPERDILQGQMSLRPGEAIVSRFTPDLLPIWRRILALPNPKLDWNGRKFDRPLALGYEMPLNGPLHDLMDMWHHAQPDLPRGLQYATSFFCPEVGPWKHQMGSDPLWYGALDVDMPQRIYAALRKSLALYREPHSGVTLLRGYQEQVVRLAPVLDRMSARGMPVDEPKRQALDATFTATLVEIDAKMQTLAPEELRPCEPKEGYKRASKIPKCCLEASDQIRLLDLEGSKLTKCDASGRRVVDPTGVVFVVRTFKDAKSKLPVERWAKLCDFTPSSKQVLAYIKWKGYKVPRNVKTDKETTDELGLRRLIREHPSDALLPLVLDHREVEKARGTYVEGWKPRAGRVHSTFGFKPATGQLSSESPNCFSADTEVLTERGWVRFDCLPAYTEIAQYDETSGKIDFSFPSAYYVFDSPGTLQHIRTQQQIDLLVTRHHDCLLRHRKTGELRRFDAHEYPEDWQQIQGGDYVGGGAHYRESMLVLIAALQADGWFVKSKRLRSQKIAFGFTKKRKIDRLRSALQAEGIDFTERTRKRVGEKDQTCFYLRDVPVWLPSWKQFDARILHMDRESFRFLAEEIWKWDGCASRRSMYASAIQSNADWVQIMTALSERRAKVRVYRGSVSPSYQVDATDDAYSLTTGRTNVPVRYFGKVYCVSMPKRTVIVRRAGRVAITGQSQNFPKHSEIARAMRRMVEARPGHHLVSFDWKSFHVLTTGFEAQDPLYCRLARLDMHSFFALVGLLKLEAPEKVLDLPDPELAAKLSWYRKQPRVWPEYACQGHPAGMTFAEVRDEKAKRTILGVGFGQSAMGMFKRNPESFANLRDSQACLEMLDRIFDKPKRWRTSVRLEADANHELMTRHGYVRRFWDVFTRKIVADTYQPRQGQLVLQGPEGRKWLLGPGDDHEACVAYRPANDAFGIKRLVMAKLGEMGLDSFFGLVNEIHDDLLFECEDARLDECIPTVKGLMETPSLYLVDPVVAPGGLWCGVDVTVGRNWDYRDSANPEGMEKVKT